MIPDFGKMTKKFSHRQDYVDIFKTFRNLFFGKLYPILTPLLGLLGLKLPPKHEFWGKNEILEMYIRSDIGVSGESKIAYCFGNRHRITSTLGFFMYITHSYAIVS